MIHISKRGDLNRGRVLGIRLLAILVGIILCSALTVVTTGINPLEMGKAVVTGSFGTARKTWIFLQKTAVLLLISLAVTPAFKMHCWNLGAEGQVLAGAMAAAACMVLLAGEMSKTAVIICMIFASVFAGALWAAIPAFFKAKFNTNETLFTLMMNYVATQIVAFFCVKWENPRGSCQIGVINQKTQIGWFPELYNRYLLVIIVVVVMTILMYFYLRYSKHGFELAVVGESERTARYVGIKVEKVILRTMLLSGALCGITGLLLVGGTDHTLTTTIVDGRGFTAVMTSWLANFNPLTMIFTCFLLVFLDRGAGEISTTFGLNQSFADILTGIIIFFIIGSEFFIRYKLSFRHSEKKEG